MEVAVGTVVGIAVAELTGARVGLPEVGVGLAVGVALITSSVKKSSVTLGTAVGAQVGIAVGIAVGMVVGPPAKKSSVTLGL